jgi:23S rRNA pseudouridine2605 synthase
VLPQSTFRNIGLARALSKLGYCSRSKAVELIRTGHVCLNGNVRRDPETPVHLERDRIVVDGQEIKREEYVYLMMNKRRGVVTTASDEKGRETVYSVLAKAHEASNLSRPRGSWLAPVGRLDKASEGLLLLTNDSEWSAHVTAPATHVTKTYHVQIARVVDESFAQGLVAGVHDENEILRAKQASVLRTGEKNCWLEIVLEEGKNRQIRRMLEALDIEVLRLIRIAIGPLELGKLAKGAVRALSDDEKQSLDRAMQPKQS